LNATNGRLTLTANGYYRIRAAANVQSDVYNNRLTFMAYLRVGTTDYAENENYNFFAWTNTSNNSDGAHGSVNFEDYLYLTSGTELQVRHKLETGTNRNFDNNLNETNLDVYMTITLERLYETNP